MGLFLDNYSLGPKLWEEPRWNKRSILALVEFFFLSVSIYPVSTSACFLCSLSAVKFHLVLFFFCAQIRFSNQLRHRKKTEFYIILALHFSYYQHFRVIDFFFTSADGMYSHVALLFSSHSQKCVKYATCKSSYQYL